MSKSNEKRVRRSATVTALITSAAGLGYDLNSGFESAVESARKLAPRNFLSLTEEQRKAYQPVIRDYGIQFKAGHLLRYLESRGYERRFGNMDRAMRVEECIRIFDKATPEAEKTNRRTDLEHKGCKAADNAWTRVKDAAGLKAPPVKRPARPSQANAKGKADNTNRPVDIRLAAPTLASANDAWKFYDNASAALLTATNKNAKSVPIAVKTAVQDFRKAIREALAAAKASAAAAKAKASAE
jgi:hypothetical protein